MCPLLAPSAATLLRNTSFFMSPNDPRLSRHRSIGTTCLSMAGRCCRVSLISTACRVARLEQMAGYNIVEEATDPYWTNGHHHHHLISCDDRPTCNVTVEKLRQPRFTSGCLLHVLSSLRGSLDSPGEPTQPILVVRCTCCCCSPVHHPVRKTICKLQS